VVRNQVLYSNAPGNAAAVVALAVYGFPFVTNQKIPLMCATLSVSNLSNLMINHRRHHQFCVNRILFSGFVTILRFKYSVCLSVCIVIYRNDQTTYSSANVLECSGVLNYVTAYHPLQSGYDPS
jgi:hypothetical protein